MDEPPVKCVRRHGLHRCAPSPPATDRVPFQGPFQASKQLFEAKGCFLEAIHFRNPLQVFAVLTRLSDTNMQPQVIPTENRVGVLILAAARFFTAAAAMATSFSARPCCVLSAYRHIGS